MRGSRLLRHTEDAAGRTGAAASGTDPVFTSAAHIAIYAAIAGFLAVGAARVAGKAAAGMDMGSAELIVALELTTAIGVCFWAASASDRILKHFYEGSNEETPER
jgi:hypothetical protein